MLYLFLVGGLGNQLFQIFTTISYSLREKTAFMFTSDLMLGGRNTYWSSFLSFLQKYTGQPVNINNCVRELDFHYSELPVIQSTDNVSLSGYFQSQKYFIENKTYIYDIIGLQEKKDSVSEIYKQLFSQYDKDIKISLHFRIGDYINLQHCHPITSLSYYIDSISYIKKNLNTEQEVCVLYFCENSDESMVDDNITILKSIYPDLKFVRCPGDVLDWQQMLLMSMCDHHIIANSTFSWWGAFFDDKENKIVCYPERWFGGSLGHYCTKDLCPSEWTII